MAKFMLLFRGGAVVRQTLSPADRKAQVGKWAAWMEELKAKGQYVAGGVPLAVEGVLVHAAHREVQEGLPSDSALLTGTYFVEAATLGEATDLAKGCPILDLDGSVEVRPVLDRPA